MEWYSTLHKYDTDKKLHLQRGNGNSFPRLEKSGIHVLGYIWYTKDRIGNRQKFHQTFSMVFGNLFHAKKKKKPKKY